MSENSQFGAPSEKLLNDATAASAQPTAADENAGLPIRKGCRACDIFVTGAATDVTVRLWGYHPAMDEWYPMGTGTGAGNLLNTSGWLNLGAPIEAIDTNEIKHYELAVNLNLFTRLFAQIVAITGGGASVDVDVVFHSPSEESW
jgi:hypothetical protein